MTLYEAVRKQIGEEGPQLDTLGYEARIDYELHIMEHDELLRRISDELETILANHVSWKDRKLR